MGLEAQQCAQPDNDEAWWKWEGLGACEAAYSLNFLSNVTEEVSVVVFKFSLKFPAGSVKDV